jgi:hypothetical protein
MSLILSGTTGVSDIDGSAATPAIRGTDTNTGIFFPAADTIAFAEGGVESMRLDSNGNVGVGTTSPGTKLDVAGNLRLSAANPVIELNNGGAQIYSTVTNTLQFATGGGIGSPTERARIDSSGNFGIGTSSPAYRLVVQDSGGETALGLNNTSTNGRNYLLVSGGASGGYAGGRFGLYSVTDGVDLMAATSRTGSTAGGTSGRGIGFANAGFWIDRGWADYPSITVCNNNFTGNTNQSQLRVHGTDATWASYPSASGADFACSIYIDGTYQTSSDRRYKTNITVIENALDKVLSMTGKRFQTINSLGEIEAGFSQNSFRFGFIAQDLQAAGLDELYKHNVDEDDGTDGFNKAYSVEYDAVVPMLVNAIKEQQAIITALTARVAALEGAQP